MLKKLTIGAVIVLFAFYMGGCLIVTLFKTELNSIAQEMKLSRLPDNRQITLSKKEFIQSKINFGEICINGGLYDYRILSDQTDAVQLLILRDETEEILLETVARFFGKTENNRNRDIPEKWIQWILTAFELPTNDFELLYSSFDIPSFPTVEMGILTGCETPQPWPPDGKL
jgi:hypothetical protein